MRLGWHDMSLCSVYQDEISTDHIEPLYHCITWAVNKPRQLRKQSLLRTTRLKLDIYLDGMSGYCRALGKIRGDATQFWSMQVLNNFHEESKHICYIWQLSPVKKVTNLFKEEVRNWSKVAKVILLLICDIQVHSLSVHLFSTPLHHVYVYICV